MTLGDIRLTASTEVLDQLVVELALASLSFDIGCQQRATCAFDRNWLATPTERGGTNGVSETKEANPLLALYSSEHEILIASYFSVVSARPLDRQLQNVQPALKAVDRVNDPVLIDVHVID